MGPDLDDPNGDTTEEVCAQCEDHLIYVEDTFVVQVMRPEIVDGAVQLVPLLDEDGDFLYEPYILHFKCFESIWEDLKEEIADAPPVADDLGVLYCDCCGSAIREYEPVMTATISELLRSKRAPSNIKGLTEIQPSGDPEVFCLWCLSTINENWLTFWDEGVTIDGECLECQHTRCWRGFDCACVCHEGDT